jgi:hypothetical protein
MPQASEKSIYTESLIAAADLSDYQYHGVKLNGTDRTIAIFAATTDVPCGVLLDEPEAAGRAGLVCALGRAPVVLAETLVSGDKIRFDASGHAAKWDPGTDTTTYIAGQILIGGAADEVGEAMINCINPARGDC